MIYSYFTFFILIIPLLYLLRSNLYSILFHWIARHITKGPSSYIHSLHINKNEKVIKLGTNEYSISDPALLTIYNDKSFLKSDQYAAFDVDGEATLFSMRDPAEHTKRAKAVRSLFSSTELRQREYIIHEQVEKSLAEVDGDCDVLGLARGYAVKTISRYALDQEYGTHSILETGRAFGLVLNDINGSATFGRSPRTLIRWFDIFKKSHIISDEVKHAYEEYDAYCRGVARNAEYHHRLSSLNLSPSQITAETSDLLFAGTDSTATTISSALWFIYNDKNILKLLRNDLESCSIDQLHQREYLNAVINEMLRLAPPVPRRLPRVVPQNSDIFYDECPHNDGWTKIIPAGSIIGLSAYSIHRSSIFRKAETFDPSRWINGDALIMEHFIPFGRGVRACIGQELARQEMRLLIHAFVTHFDGEVVSVRPEYIDNFNATIKDPVIIRFTKRI